MNKEILTIILWSNLHHKQAMIW